MLLLTFLEILNLSTKNNNKKFLKVNLFVHFIVEFSSVRAKQTLNENFCVSNVLLRNSKKKYILLTAGWGHMPNLNLRLSSCNLPQILKVVKNLQISNYECMSKSVTLGCAWKHMNWRKSYGRGCTCCLCSHQRWRDYTCWSKNESETNALLTLYRNRLVRNCFFFWDRFIQTHVEVNLI